MDESQNQRNPADSPRDLPDLATGLSMLYRSSAQVPQNAADDAVRAAIRRHYDGFFIRRKTVAWRMLPWASAAAAVLVIAVLWIALPQRTQQPITSQSTIARHLPADVDRNGRIDILDAYSLARRLQAIATSDPSLDLNHDGAIDRLDVDAIAMQAVSLDRDEGASS